MKLAMLGLGRMGGNMARRMMEAGHEIVAFDRNMDAVAELAGHGATGASSLTEVAAALDSPAIYWLMLPAGEITDNVMREVAEVARSGDIVVDGGNSFWKHDIARSKFLAERGVHFVDVGVSGGVWGLTRGYCMMIGGEPEQVEHLDPLFRALAPGMGSIERTKTGNGPDHRWKAEHGYVHCGPAGSGHFVKMVHNGIEYGMMQAYAEGFDILKARAKEDLDIRYDLNLADIAEVWRRGSVISSWLLDLISSALNVDQSLSKFSGRVADSGEGRWTVDAAMEEAVPIDVLAAALFARYRSRVEVSFADQMLSAMRFGFGGHVEMPQ
ncbi:decarboxylating 6-phosphogluconate dehydrogenase [Sphingomonas sp. HDW15A]|uniref:phosphogluconate dehydrogenase (NAD(+)-dependent, decarboxylating) n=1 Tax=Sphingomonas sp. HDW15A TaxID=2714942 RepID=UPI001407D040|nr:decarboxylating 6-phosphogluconate dehydrogenase [Sphingomonas sp. HDW15A]QIK95379.1 decarboxylating 6-phosphogluconate dehydrogenase [Sphingomonas sp. HDW15A]